MTYVDTWIDDNTQITVADEDYVLRIKQSRQTTVKLYFDDTHPYNRLCYLRDRINELIERCGEQQNLCTECKQIAYDKIDGLCKGCYANTVDRLNEME